MVSWELSLSLSAFSEGLLNEMEPQLPRSSQALEEKTEFIGVAYLPAFLVILMREAFQCTIIEVAGR